MTFTVSPAITAALLVPYSFERASLSLAPMNFCLTCRGALYLAFLCFLGCLDTIVATPDNDSCCGPDLGVPLSYFSCYRTFYVRAFGNSFFIRDYHGIVLKGHMQPIRTAELLFLANHYCKENLLSHFWCAFF